MSKRYIRLKELQPNLTKFVYPNPNYYETRPLLRKNEAFYTSIDNNGYMLTGLNQKSQNKIFLCGASTVENYYVKSSSRLNCLLEVRCLKNNMDYEVVNAGSSGSTLLTIFNAMLNKKIGNGSVIVLFIPSNDYRVLTMRDSYWNNHEHYANIVPSDEKGVEEKKLFLKDNILDQNMILDLGSVEHSKISNYNLLKTYRL